MNAASIKFWINSNPIIKLVKVNLKDDELKRDMSIHYSQPKGFVGRRITYGITFEGKNYGFISGGSPTLHLPGRNEFFNVKNEQINNCLVNNIFYHIEKIEGKYPLRNFTTKVLKEWRKRIVDDWYNLYKIILIGYESLVEPPRTGELYLKDKWTQVGITKGYTCKRVSSNIKNKTDLWTGSRIWNTEELKPKLVFCRKIH